MEMPIELGRYIQEFARPITRPTWREGSNSGLAVRESRWWKDYMYELKYVCETNKPWYVLGVRPTYTMTTWYEWCLTKMILKSQDFIEEEIIIYGYDIEYLFLDDLYYSSIVYPLQLS